MEKPFVFTTRIGTLLKCLHIHLGFVGCLATDVLNISLLLCFQHLLRFQGKHWGQGRGQNKNDLNTAYMGAEEEPDF